MCMFGHVWSPYLLTWDQGWSCDVLAWQKGHMVDTVGNKRLWKSQRHVRCWCESQLSREGWKGSHGPLRWLYYLLCNEMSVFASYSNSTDNLKGHCLWLCKYQVYWISVGSLTSTVKALFISMFVIYELRFFFFFFNEFSKFWFWAVVDMK